jgi:hypothetical protein
MFSEKEQHSLDPNWFLLRNSAESSITFSLIPLGEEIEFSWKISFVYHEALRRFYYHEWQIIAGFSAYNKGKLSTTFIIFFSILIIRIDAKLR